MVLAEKTLTSQRTKTHSAMTGPGYSPLTLCAMFTFILLDGYSLPAKVGLSALQPAVSTKCQNSSKMETERGSERVREGAGGWGWGLRV